MKKYREKVILEERLKKASEDVFRAEILFEASYGLQLLGKETEISGRKIFEKFGLFLEDDEVGEEKIEAILPFKYVLFYKGNFATFFQLYQEVNHNLQWNNTDKTEVVYIYISKNEKTSNLLKNVMKIGDQNLGKN